MMLASQARQRAWMTKRATKKSKSRLTRLGLIGAGLSLMRPREFIEAAGIVMLMVLGGLFESAVVALVFPLVYVILDPAKFQSTRFGHLISGLFGNYPFDQMFGYIAVTLIALLIGGAAITSLAVYASERHSAHCRNRMAHDLLRRIVAAPYLWLIQNNTAIVARHIYEDVRNWRRDFIQSLLSIIQSAIMIISPAAVVIAIAPVDGLIALLVVAIICSLIVFLLRSRFRKISSTMRTASNATMKTLLQILGGMREVIVSGRADHFVATFDEHHGDQTRATLAARMWSNAPSTFIYLFGQLAFIGTASIFWWRGESGTEIAAQLVLIGIVVSRVVPAFNRLATNVSVLFRAAPFVESLIDFCDDIDRGRKQFGHKTGGVPVPSQWKRLSLQEVSFRYPGSESWSLEGVTIILERGRSYGFVGRSGAGKSTLVNLLLGLIEPACGTVRVDDEDLSRILITDWHRRFGYVPQDPFIFDVSLRDNIVFGENSDHERVLEVIDQVRLTSVAAELPAGLDTLLGERGRRLSGGQAQRVAIARALFRRPDILFLDEATSALDSITESEIYSAIDRLRGNVMALMIAHRVTSLRRCDQIFVLDQGRIIDSGTFDDLMVRSKLFRRLAAQDEPAVAVV
jgi:ABC-type multidrug transport system fused ATPase/permease subunit